jgi:hypothetical protein
MKICFVSSLFTDNYKNFGLPGKFHKNEYYHYFLFTNLSKSLFNTSWTLINLNIDLNIIENKNVFYSRYVKFLIWKYFEEEFNIKYDIIYYCDSSFGPNDKINWEEESKKILISNSGIMQLIHHIENGKGGITNELYRIQASKKLSKENTKILNNNLVEYVKLNLDSFNNYLNIETEENKEIIKNNSTELDNIIVKNILSKNILYENTYFGYSTQNINIQKLMNEFWELFKTNKYSIRDQPLWNLLLLKYNITPIIMNDNYKHLRPDGSIINDHNVFSKDKDKIHFSLTTTNKTFNRNIKNLDEVKNLDDEFKLTLCISYFNQDKNDLLMHLNYYKSYSEEAKKKIKLLIIDDCSKIGINKLLSKTDIDGINIDILQVTDDLYCNISGVRNLAAQYCTTKWIMILDMDTLVSSTLATQLLEIVNNIDKNKQLWNTVFKFNRKVINNNKHEKHKIIHPAVCLIQKKHYWKAGGCEEDLVGHYGYTDPCFWTRVSRANINIQILEDKYIDFNPNAEADINRNTLHNFKIYEDYVMNNKWSNKYVRFNWKKINY